MKKSSKKSTGRKQSKTIIQKLPKWLQVGLTIFLIFLLLTLLLISIFEVVFFKKIYPGVKTLNLDLGGKTKVQAEEILKKTTLEQKEILQFNFEDQSWKVKLANLNFKYLPYKTVEKAFGIGRSSNLIKNLCQQGYSLVRGVNLKFDYQIHQGLLETVIATISAQVNTPAIPPSIQFEEENNQTLVKIQKGESGKQLETEKLKQELDQKLSNLSEPVIELPMKQLLPDISQEQIEVVKNRAEKLLGKTINLSYQKSSWQLEQAELINFLSFSDEYDQEKIASFSAQLSLSVDRPPQNALFKFSNGRVIEFKPAKEGQTLNRQQTQDSIGQALESLEKTEATKINIDLSVQLTEPKIANEEVNALGIKELIGRGESWFRGSITSRLHNIKLASTSINGLLVAPGEIFSLNNALGDVSEQTGYQKAWIIKEGRTVLGDGGGVCQVSTTLFRAILNAGLPVIERRAHAYRVSYYEQNYQVGVDATVFAPSPDLKFKNDTPGHILIQTDIDPVNMKATYTFYGTSDGRQAYISPSRIWDQVPPPPDLYQDDPTLPVGTVKQIDWAAWGAKTAFDWKVIRGNEVLQEKTFYSNYQPWQAVFLRGTKQ